MVLKEVPGVPGVVLEGAKAVVGGFEEVPWGVFQGLLERVWEL